jgi:hypothetical protein
LQKLKVSKQKWKHVAHPTQPYPCSFIVLCWGFARKCLDRRVRDLGNTGWHGAKTILGLWTLERLVLIVGNSLSWMVSISNSFNIDFLGWDELGGSGFAPSLRLKDQSPLDSWLLCRGPTWRNPRAIEGRIYASQVPDLSQNLTFCAESFLTVLWTPLFFF